MRTCIAATVGAVTGDVQQIPQMVVAKLSYATSLPKFFRERKFRPGIIGWVGDGWPSFAVLKCKIRRISRVCDHQVRIFLTRGRVAFVRGGFGHCCERTVVPHSASCSLSQPEAVDGGWVVIGKRQTEASWVYLVEGCGVFEQRFVHKARKRNGARLARLKH